MTGADSTLSGRVAEFAGNLTRRLRLCAIVLDVSIDELKSAGLVSQADTLSSIRDELRSIERDCAEIYWDYSEVTGTHDVGRAGIPKTIK